MGKIISNGIDYTGGGSSTLSGLSDVSLTTPVIGDALIYDGAEWVNTPLSAVATSGDYTDLINTPSLATVATSGLYSDLSGTPSLATVATSGLYSDLSGTPSLATVATSGSYTDLSNKPTIPTALSDLTDDSTHRVVTDTQISTWNGKSDFSGSYNDLTDKPTIPTVNDGTLTIQQNGTTVGTFTANQSGNTTVNLSGGGSGHTIYDQSGTALADESGLQFKDARLADDSGNSKTTVEIVKQVTKAQLNALGANTDGLYEVTDENDTLSADNVVFDNTGTGFVSTDVQHVIGEISQRLTKNIVNSTWQSGVSLANYSYILRDGDYVYIQLSGSIGQNVSPYTEVLIGYVLEKPIVLTVLPLTWNNNILGYLVISDVDGSMKVTAFASGVIGTTLFYLNGCYRVN